MILNGQTFAKINLAQKRHLHNLMSFLVKMEVVNLQFAKFSRIFLKIEHLAHRTVIPNPAAENSILCVNSASDVSCEVEITDMFGKLIKVIKVESGYTETSVTFAEFTEGIYIVSLKKNGQTIAVNRVTIEK